MLTAFVFGLLPAMRAIHVDPQSALQTSTTRVSASRESRRTRHLLVGAEVACTVALLIVTGLLVRSFATLLDQDRDFDSSRVTYAQVFLYAPQYRDTGKNFDQARAAFEDRALAALAGIPGVQSVASTSETPMGGETWINLIQRPDRPLAEAQIPDANIRWISPSYATTLRIPVVAGRDLSDGDKSHPDNALISEKAARSIWPGENPIGHTFKMGENTVYTVVGVLADARINDLQTTANMIYLPYWQNPLWRLNFLIRSPQSYGRTGACDSADDLEYRSPGGDPGPQVFSTSRFPTRSPTNAFRLCCFPVSARLRCCWRCWGFTESSPIRFPCGGRNLGFASHWAATRRV